VDRLRADIAAIASTLKEMAADQGNALSKRLKEQADHLYAKADRTADTVADHIQHNPMTSLLSAFAIGAVLGALMTRR